MNRRLSLLAGALTIALTAPQAATAVAAPQTSTSAQQSGVSSQRDPDADPEVNQALARLRADADSQLRVHRAVNGTVDFVSSTDGEAMVEAEATSTPARTAADQLTRYGEAFGIDGGKSRAVVRRTIDSATGGSVVRAEQVVDGVPVFGGQVVMSLDENDGVVSVDAATTEATEVPAPVVSEARAERSALSVTAKTHRVAVAKLSVTRLGRRVYDPAIVHTADHLGARPVWEFVVTDGSEIRETVLVGTDRGEIALHFNDAPGVNRVVCDNNSARTVDSDAVVPLCTAPARAEGGGPSGVTDVNLAYSNLGAASVAFDEIAGIDLTDLIGVGTPKKLMATVRWCFAEDPCPLDNAYWDGNQMLFGSGYAGADDVVAHELTHGYVQYTSGLFMLHQSGAINESVADIVGEVVDHRYNPSGPEDNTGWNLGEDVPGPPLRNLMDPTTIGSQPDRMTSANYKVGDVLDDAGEVHHNSGVGNKTAYLISQGGTFNNQTVTGIDGSDATLAKTGLLYLEVIPRLTSGAEYADLGRVLGTVCDELASNNTDGFTTADCTSVRAAVAATELAQRPTNPAASAAEAPVTCAAGTRLVTLRRDDDATASFAFARGALWQRTPQNETPEYSHGGTSSWFGWNPDPSLDGISSSALTSGSFVVPASQASYLHFHHAHVFEWYDAAGPFPAFYPDGGQVLVQTLSGGTWTTRAVPWVNGPNRSWNGTTYKVFGGDSHGYGSSRADLTSLRGQTARIVFKVLGDQNTFLIGWWLDDVRLYTCPNSIASVPRTTAVTGLSSVRVSWTPPSYVGASPVASYRITRSDGRVTNVPGTARTTTLGALNLNAALTVRVAAVNSLGQAGAASIVRIDPTATAVGAPVKAKKKNRLFAVTGRVVKRGTTSVVAGAPVILQRRLATSSLWVNVATGTTNSLGVKAWAVRQKKGTYYRVLSRGVRTFFASTSGARLVKKP